MVFNATSASLRGELPAVRQPPFDWRRKRTSLPTATADTVSAAGENAGVTQLADGVGMLVEQAAECSLVARHSPRDSFRHPCTEHPASLNRNAHIAKHRAYTRKMDKSVHSANTTTPAVTSRPARRPGPGRMAAAPTGQSAQTTSVPRERTRTNDPERTRAETLPWQDGVCRKGLDGARIDEIAAATRTSKRMIYYYFGSKEGLYVAVLEAAYRETREAEAEPGWTT